MDTNLTPKEEKKIIIFFRNHLALGGVETYMYEQAKRLREKGWQIIWVRKHPFAKLDSSLADVFASESTIVWNQRVNRRKIAKMLADDNAKIQVIAFNMYQFAMAEKFKRDFRLCQINTFLFVTHYMGEALFFEENHTGERKETVRNRMAKIVRKIHEQNQIRYFNIKHIEKMSANYEYKIHDAESLFVPPRESECTVFDEERSKRLATRQRFNLMTVSRFDFPHKGYIFGLIKAYAQLKNKYPQMELTIVGYGRGQKQVEETLSKLDDKVKCGVHLVGKASPEQLNEYYKDANLNISVAACCSQGARMGTLSIPARHYDYNCEVYGFFPESKYMTVSDEPGQSVMGYIEAVLNMSEDEYCDKCRDAFNTFNDPSFSQRKRMEELENLSTEATLSHVDIRYITRQELWRELRSKCRRIYRTLKKLTLRLKTRVS